LNVVVGHVDDALRCRFQAGTKKASTSIIMVALLIRLNVEAHTGDYYDKDDDDE